ncbi:MAG TPA: hypothetical protein VLT16_02465 [Candidatus Limnocylindrales bacterium]|nr:hypothetical protein [Candidatus Limnocylindrales bacterium]
MAETVKAVLQAAGFLALVAALLFLPTSTSLGWGAFWSPIVWIAGALHYEWLIHLTYMRGNDPMDSKHS